MILREPCLPPGWYPRDKGAIKEFLEPIVKPAANSSQTSGRKAVPAAVAPHAGWYYSGIPAAMAVSVLDPAAETVVVIGGHLPGGMPVLSAPEDGVKTPLGTIKIDRELRELFEKQVKTRPDNYADNTVEVLLPMVHFLFPRSDLLWLRFPGELSSFDAGKLLAECAASLRRRIAVLASTDLTHYGRNYGFSPKGSGKPALDWVKKVNDAAFINAVLEGNPESVLERALEDSSACSAGAVLGTMGFTASGGKVNARLLDYRTSADMGRDSGESIPDSFVGYAAISLETG